MKFKRTTACVTAFAMTAALSAGMVAPQASMADEIKWPVPTAAKSATTYDAQGNVTSSPLLCASFGCNTVIAYWLGITSPVASSPGTQGGQAGSGAVSDQDLATVQSSNLFGTFGSPANTEPDVYMWNLYYNFANPSSGLSVYNRDEVALLCNAAGTSADTSISIGGTSTSLYYRPEIVLGGNGTKGSTAYIPLVEDINSNKPGDENYVAGDETYDPYLLDGFLGGDFCNAHIGSIRGVNGMLYTIGHWAEEIQKKDSTKTTRYGNSAYELAENFEETYLGLQARILKGIEDGSLKKKVIASVKAIDADTGTATLFTPCPDYVLGSTCIADCMRPQYSLQDVTTNLVDALGISYTVDYSGAAAGAAAGSFAGNTVTVSLADLQKADIVYYCGHMNTNAIKESTVVDAFAKWGIAEKDMPTGVYVASATSGNGSFDVDNCKWMIEWFGQCYPELFQATSADAYYYSKICHVADSYLPAAVSLCCSNMTMLNGDTIDHTESYYVAEADKVEALVKEGMQYYVANYDKICAEHLNMNPIKGSDGSVLDRRITDGTYVVAAKTAQSVSITTASKSYKANAKTGKLAAAKTFKVAVKGAKTAVTFSKVSGNKNLTISKAGKVTVKKGLAKGTYKIKVKAKAAASDTYKAATATKTIKVTIK